MQRNNEPFEDQDFDDYFNSDDAELLFSTQAEDDFLRGILMADESPGDPTPPPTAHSQPPNNLLPPTAPPPPPACSPSHTQHSVGHSPQLSHFSASISPPLFSYPPASSYSSLPSLPQQPAYASTSCEPYHDQAAPSFPPVPHQQPFYHRQSPLPVQPSPLSHHQPHPKQRLKKLPPPQTPHSPFSSAPSQMHSPSQFPSSFPPASPYPQQQQQHQPPSLVATSSDERQHNFAQPTKPDPTSEKVPKKRGRYNCRQCGQPKKDHICTAAASHNAISFHMESSPSSSPASTPPMSPMSPASSLSPPSLSSSSSSSSPDDHMTGSLFTHPLHPTSPPVLTSPPPSTAFAKRHRKSPVFIDSSPRASPRTPSKQLSKTQLSSPLPSPTTSSSPTLRAALKFSLPPLAASSSLPAVVVTPSSSSSPSISYQPSPASTPKSRSISPAKQHAVSGSPIVTRSGSPSPPTPRRNSPSKQRQPELAVPPLQDFKDNLHGPVSPRGVRRSPRLTETSGHQL